MNKPQYLIIHHVGGSDANPLADTSHHTFEIVDAYHKSLGWGGIGYHYFIDKAGKVTQGRKDDAEGAHTKGYNSKSLGICLAGNFDATLPTKEQETALKALLLAKMSQYGLTADKIVPHRKFAVKTCFGRKLSDTWAADLTKAPAPQPAPQPSNDAIRDEIRKHLGAVDVLLGKLK